MESETEVGARVLVVNTANALANKLHPMLYDLFVPFVGKKIFDSDGDMLKELKSFLFKMPESFDGPYCHRDKLFCRVHSFVNWIRGTHSIACTHGVVVHIAEVADGSITRMYSVDTNRRTDYLEEAVLKQRELVVSLKRQYDDALSELYLFGEGE